MCGTITALDLPPVLHSGLFHSSTVSFILLPRKYLAVAARILMLRALGYVLFSFPSSSLLISPLLLRYGLEIPKQRSSPP